MNPLVRRMPGPGPPTFLSAVLRFDLPRLGDIRGLRALQLQCYIGTDTWPLRRDDGFHLVPPVLS